MLCKNFQPYLYLIYSPQLFPLLIILDILALIHNVLVIPLFYNLCRLLLIGKKAYYDDPHTRMLIDRLSINSPLYEQTILHFPASYRSAIVRNLLGLLEGRLVY